MVNKWFPEVFVNVYFIELIKTAISDVFHVFNLIIPYDQYDIHSCVILYGVFKYMSKLNGIYN